MSSVPWWHHCVWPNVWEDIRKPEVCDAKTESGRFKTQSIKMSLVSTFSEISRAHSFIRRNCLWPWQDLSGPGLARANHCDTGTAVPRICFLLQKIYPKFLWNCPTPHKADQEISSIFLGSELSGCLWKFEVQACNCPCVSISQGWGTVHFRHGCQ